jgi:hypothetical protein
VSMCANCDELNKDALFFEDWTICEDCKIEIKEFINLESYPGKYIMRDVRVEED